MNNFLILINYEYLNMLHTNYTLFNYSKNEKVWKQYDIYIKYLDLWKNRYTEKNRIYYKAC